MISDMPRKSSPAVGVRVNIGCSATAPQPCPSRHVFFLSKRLSHGLRESTRACQPEAIAIGRDRSVGHRGAIACDESWLTHTVARPSHPSPTDRPVGLRVCRYEGLTPPNREQKYPHSDGNTGRGGIPVGYIP